MLRISQGRNRAKSTPEGGSVSKLAEVRRFGCERRLQGRGTQLAKSLGRIVAVVLLPFLAVSGLLTCTSVASAQTPPDSVTAAVVPLAGIRVTFVACQVSTEGNCVYPFSIYRSVQPTFTQPPIGLAALGNGANSYTGTYDDQKFTKGQAYYYQVCSGSQALSDGSNCLHTKTPVTVPISQPPAPPTVTLTAAATTLIKGQQTDLNWTSANATSLDLEPGVGKVGLTGSTSVNPVQTTTYTLTANGPGGTAKANVTINIACLTPWAPPVNVTAVGGLSDVPLKWTNPSTSAGQTCPAPPTQVLIYRMGTNGYEQLAALDKTTNNGTLPTRYTDSGPLMPHTGYMYLVCEGGSPNWQNPNNCASPPGVMRGAAGYGTVTWGADPVLTATRVSATTVKLQIALDQFTVSSVRVIRQGSDDPCRQGGTLGNGLQGCPTVTTNPNGVSTPVGQTTTVYNWDENPGSSYPPGFQNSNSAPYVINTPDDTTVKPGVEYYYLAQVVWLWSVAQDSDTVTVPSAYATASSQHVLGGGIKPIKLNGAPIPPSQSQTAARPAIAPMASAASPMMTAAPITAAPPSQSAPAARLTIAPKSVPASRTLSPVRSAAPLPGAANLEAAIKEAQQKPHDAQALYSLGKAYCASRLRDTGVSYMYMALLLAERAGNSALAAQIKGSLAQQGVSGI